MSTTTETSTQSPSTNPYYKRAYALSNVESARKFYDEWASRYDNDTVTDGYTGPTESVKAIVKFIGPKDMPSATFLDAGCGTGLVGVLLAREGAATIDGLDLSPGMLKKARNTGVYRSLGEADLSKPVAKPDETYDVLACVGTLTHGHVGPKALPEFVRVVNHGGLVVATVIEAIWESGGYQAEVERLAASKQVEVLHTDTVGYRSSANLGAKMLVMKRL